MAQIISIYARVCLLALVDIAAHLGDQIAPKPQFWGVNRDFPAKRAKYWNWFSSQTCQILKCSYYKNYCIDQILQSDRDPQVLTVGCPNMPQTNPRWRTAAILKNWKILICSQPIDRFWRNLACWCVSTIWTPINNKISRFQKSKNSKNRNISATERPILTEFGILMRLGPPDTDRNKNSRFRKFKMAAAAILKNRKILISS